MSKYIDCEKCKNHQECIESCIECLCNQCTHRNFNNECCAGSTTDYYEEFDNENEGTD